MKTGAMKTDEMSGTFVAICGPSGAGKDTVLKLAREQLGARADLVFARRVITRAADGGEDNEGVSAEEFARRTREGGFLLHWQAHGLSYGLPVDLLDRVRAGTSVIANVSRGVLDKAQRLGVPLCVVEITASPQVLAQRLDGRGREDEAAQAMRLARNALYAGGITADHVILNDGAPQEAARALAGIICATLAPLAETTA